MGVTRPAVISHLQNLKSIHIIDVKKQGKRKEYFIKPSLVEQLEDVLVEVNI